MCADGDVVPARWLSTGETDRASVSDRREHAMRILGIDLDLLTPAERRDLANALLRAAWSAALEDTRVLLLDLLLEVDEAALGGWS
jgi:hypothetical protein